jgi:hypothetical protein
MVVEVAHSGGSRIRVREICESVAFGFASLGVHHQSELGDSAGRTKDVFDLLLSEI